MVCNGATSVCSASEIDDLVPGRSLVPTADSSKLPAEHLRIRFPLLLCVRCDLRSKVSDPADTAAWHVLAEIIQADVSKTLALTISFGRIRADQFWSTFQERLGPLMMEVGRVCKTAPPVRAVRESMDCTVVDGQCIWSVPSL